MAVATKARLSAGVVVVNLSNGGLARCLILNLGHEPITLEDALTMTEAWGDSALSVAPGHWQLLQPV